MSRRTLAILLVVLGSIATPAAPGRACDMNVREAGFITQRGLPYAPRPYNLWYVCSKPTPGDRAYAERIGALCKELGLNLNVTLIDTSRLNVAMLKTLREHGISTDALPASAVVRVGGEMGALLIQPGRLDADAVRSLGMSPKKREMKKLLSQESNYCVLLFIAGGNAQADAAALGRLRTAAEAHVRAKPRQAMPILELDRADPREAFLLSELGVEPKTREPAAVIVFGKGRILLPVLRGRDLREDTLAARFAFLNHNASDCGDDPVFVNKETRDLLLRWEPELDRSIVLQIVKAGTVPELLETLRSTGWIEVSFDAAGNPIMPPIPEEAAPGAKPGSAAAVAPLWVYVVPAIALALLAVAVVGAIVLRRKRAG